MVQHAGGHEDQARAAVEPRHAEARDRRGARPCLLRRAREAGARQRYALVSDSGPDSRLLPDVPSEPARACLLPRARPGHPCEDLLQVRGQQHLRLPQAQQRRRPGLLREGAGPQGRHHRDGRGPVGHGAFDGVRVLRPRLQGLHGEVLLRAEALPPRGDAHLWRLRHAVPLDGDERGPRDQRRASRHNGVPRLRHFRGR